MVVATGAAIALSQVRANNTNTAGSIQVTAPPSVTPTYDLFTSAYAISDDRHRTNKETTERYMQLSQQGFPIVTTRQKRS